MAELRDMLQRYVNFDDNDLLEPAAHYDDCPREYRNDFMQFCICVLAVDEHITKEETAFVSRMFE